MLEIVSTLVAASLVEREFTDAIVLAVGVASSVVLVYRVGPSWGRGLVKLL